MERSSIGGGHGSNSKKMGTKSWNIPLTSCSNHLNGKRQSKKMGPLTTRIHGLID